MLNELAALTLPPMLDAALPLRLPATIVFLSVSPAVVEMRPTSAEDLFAVIVQLVTVGGAAVVDAAARADHGVPGNGGVAQDEGSRRS